MKRFLLPVLVALVLVLLAYDIYSYRELSVGTPLHNMNDPAIRQAMLKEQKQMVTDEGNRTAAALSLNPEQTKILITALTDQVDRIFNRQTEIMQADPDRRAEIVKQMSEEVKRDEAKYRESLGEPLYARIVELRNTQMLKAEADDLRVQFGKTPTPLQDKQAMQLAKVLLDEMARMDSAKAASPVPAADGTDEWRQAIIARRLETNQYVLAQAKAFLKPEQLATLKQKQDLDLDRYKDVSSQIPSGRPPSAR